MLRHRSLLLLLLLLLLLQLLTCVIFVHRIIERVSILSLILL
jgi:hypothetical protein